VTTYRTLSKNARQLNGNIAREALRISESTKVSFRDVLVAMKTDPGPVAKKLGMSEAFVLMWAAQALQAKP
jgi:hypothetical protein